MTQTPNPFAAVHPEERARAYATLAGSGPVHDLHLGGGVNAWVVTDPAAVRHVLTDDRLVRAASPVRVQAERVCPELVPALYSHMLHASGEEHTRLRRLVAGAFTRRRVESLEPGIGRIADGLLDDIAATPPGESVDLIEAYAYPLPMTVIAELLGLDAADRPEFRRLNEVFLANVPLTDAELAAGLGGLVGLLRGLVAERRARPADDLTSALLAVHEHGDRLSEDELTSMLWLLTVAGHVTTVNLIGNAVRLLLAHPDQLARVRREPALMAAAVEEVLRFDGPLQTALALRATSAVPVGAVEIPAGALVLPALMAANRQPSERDERGTSEELERHCDRDGRANPDAFDVARDPNPHIAFGHGVHHCLGAPLARLEGRVALTRLFERFDNLRLAVGDEDLVLAPGAVLHGLRALPVHL